VIKTAPSQLMSVGWWLLEKEDNMLLWFIFLSIHMCSSFYSRPRFRVYFGQDEHKDVDMENNITGSGDLAVKFSFSVDDSKEIPLNKSGHTTVKDQEVKSKSRALLRENISKNKNKNKQLIAKLIKLINKFGKKSIKTLLPF
jgi:hypothetical protein